MQRVFLLLTVIGCAFIVGCASQENLQTLRAEITAMERQFIRQEKGTIDQLKALDLRLANLEQSQAKARRDLAQSIAASEELRVETQRLQGTIQEAQYRMQRHATPSAEMRDLLATRIAELETRLNALESRLNPTQSRRSAPPPVPSQRASKPSQPVQQQPPPQPAPRDASATRAYDRAFQEYQRGNYEVAIVLFKQFLRQHPKATQAAQAQYWIGESLYAQRQYEAAIVAFDEVIQKYPGDTHVPTALLKQGYAFAELKDLRNARFFLQQVLKKYPQRSEAQQAEEKLKQLKQRQG
jgi:tol-pal system protein YbgF